MRTLLFIRHAETDMAGTFCGHSDPPVNQRGCAQIEELLGTLADESVGAIYSSDLARARTTANAIGIAFRLSPIAMPALREIGFGEWEGLSWQQIEARDAVYARRWSEAYPHMPAPGGESFEAFRARVTGAVEHLLSLADGSKIAVVTHAGVMRVALRVFCGLDEKEAWEQTKSYCGFFRYTHEETCISGGSR
jgi:alpha-ribazole phosphatase/probable phosphoglycerate mutase